MGSQSTARAYRCNARRASAALRLFAADAVAVAIQVVFIRPDDPDSSGVDRAVSAAAFAVDIAGDVNAWVVRRVTFSAGSAAGGSGGGSAGGGGSGAGSGGGGGSGSAGGRGGAVVVAGGGGAAVIVVVSVVGSTGTQRTR
jgi:uncharacterized membrane protein YgcG